MVSVSGSTTVHRDYIREFEYRDFSPTSLAKELIHTEEGYIQYNGSTGVNTYHYYLRDHLGNVRGVLRRTGATTGTVEQQSDYYPFGLQKVIASGGINQYLYNGKELQGELGYYDYGARQYDPLIGRWNVVDPVAEGYKIVSPYAYVGNDPVLFLDPNGMYKVSSDGTITIDKSHEIAALFNYLSARGHASAAEIANHIMFGGGYQFEIGRVRDAFRNHAWFISHGPRVGFNINIGFNQKAIRSMYDKPFTISNYQGVSSGYSLGILMGGVEFSGNRRNPNYNNADWNLNGMDYNQIGFSVFQGIDFGLAWSRTNTRFIWRK